MLSYPKELSLALPRDDQTWNGTLLSATAFTSPFQGAAPLSPLPLHHSRRFAPVSLSHSPIRFCRHPRLVSLLRTKPVSPRNPDHSSSESALPPLTLRKMRFERVVQKCCRVFSDPIMRRGHVILPQYQPRVTHDHKHEVYAGGPQGANHNHAADTFRLQHAVTETGLPRRGG